MLSYILALIILAVVLAGLSLGPDATFISMKYFDSILHLLAGVGLGFFFNALTLSIGSRRWNTRWAVVFIVFGGGVAWEIFEAYFNITGFKLWTTMYYLDTAKDLLLDVVGAYLAVHLVIKK